MSCDAEREETDDPSVIGKLKSVTFLCDHDGCEAKVEDKDIPLCGGLRALDWECSGGKHYCPQHRVNT